MFVKTKERVTEINVCASALVWLMCAIGFSTNLIRQGMSAYAHCVNYWFAAVLFYNIEQNLCFFRQA
jgi:hypothetical protein